VAERIVIDASVAIALIRREAQRPAIRQATRRWAQAGAKIIVPSHFWAEVVNVLVRRYRQPEPEVIEAMGTLDQLAIETIELDRPTLLLALAPMSEAGLSAYDALYLALAISTESLLATVDRRLADAAGSRAILFADDGRHRLAETRLPYGPETKRELAWIRSAAVGAHIAELRRSAIATSD
jgi:predicted nucleic acid-binding protein